MGMIFQKFRSTHRLIIVLDYIVSSSAAR